MTFTEANTVEKMILDTVAPKRGGEPSAWKEERAGWKDSLGSEMAEASSRSPRQAAADAHWDYLPAAQLPRQTGDVMVEPWVREALIRLNPEIAAQPDRADEVIYNLRACILSVQADGLVRANENFMAWLRGEKTMPFGPNGEHVTVRLVDAAHPARTG